MIDYIVDYGVSIGIVIILFIIIIFFYLNNNKKTKLFKKLNAFDEKFLTPLEFPVRILNIVKSILILVLFLCGAQASASIKDIRTAQKSICEKISKVDSNVRKSEEYLNKCMQDNTETIIDRLDCLLCNEEPNNVK